jgi:predicted ester cyclase
MMSAADNKARVVAFYEGDFIRNHTATLEEVFDADFLDHDPPGPGMPSGIGTVRAVMAMLATAFPDRVIQVHDAVAEGDRVALRFEIRGTQHGPFLGEPPAAQKRRLKVMAFLRLVDGRIAERWGSVQVLGE